MTTRVRLRLGIASLVGVASLAAAAPALAAPSVSVNGSSQLVVTGEAGGETFVITTVGDPGGSVQITGPAGMTAPAGCSANGSGTTITCPSSVATSVVLDGAGGDDTITINDPRGGSTATGGANDDTLNAGSTRLTNGMTGGAGNDTFNGLAAEGDTFVAEVGNDTYHGGTAVPPAEPGPDVDLATYQLHNATDSFSLVGATGGNISLDDTLNDSDGQGGTDNVGGDVEDVTGADGNDTLSAGSNAVDFFGEAGDDTLVGSPQADNLEGNEGGDAINGGDGDDEISDGDRDGDYYDPATPPPAGGNDRLDGGPGDDTLTERFGADDVAGGPGTDTVLVSRLADQPVDPTATQFPNQKYQALTISLDDQPNDGATGANEGDNIHSNVENVDASQNSSAGFPTDFASVAVTGSPAPNDGADTIHSAGGADNITAVDKTTDSVNCGSGADNVAADLPGENPARADILTGCETVTGTSLAAPTFTLPDSSAPKVALSGATTVKAKKFLKGFVLPVGVACDQACAVGGDVVTSGARLGAAAKVGDLAIGSGSLKLGTGKRTLKAKVAKRYRASVRRKLRTRKQRRKGIKLSVAITVKNASGQSRTARRTFKIKG
jgi:hypothetical protein